MGIFSKLKERLTGSGKDNTPRVLPRPGQLGIDNAGRIQPVGTDDITKFVNFGEKIYRTSTNVAWGQYDHAKEELIIGYNNGDVYAYQNVSEAEAISFLTAPSAGKWVWDVLRIRGTHDGYQKPFVKIG